MNNIPSFCSTHYMETPSQPSSPARDTFGCLLFNEESPWGSPDAGAFCSPLGVQHPQPGQGCTAPRNPCQTPLPSFLVSEKYNGREPGKGKDIQGIAPHPEMESQCGTCILVQEAALIPPLCRSPQHNSSPPSTSPRDLLCSFEDCSTKTLSTENINLQVTLVLLTAFIQCSYFVVSRKALHLFFSISCKSDQGRTVIYLLHSKRRDTLIT